MSIQDLKDRLRDVPGIETLTMQYLTGRDCYGFDGHLIAVDPMTSMEEVEQAIRNAARLPAVKITAQKTTDNSMSITGLQPGSIKEKLDQMKQMRSERRSAAMAKLDAANAKYDGIDSQIEQLAAQIDKEADDALQEFATFTNGGPV